jgi:4-aminobutyrate aminotransferase-like enzyme
MKVKQLDKAFWARGSDADDLQLVRSDGSFVFDARGRKYVNFMMGWCVGNFGWDNKEIREGIRRSRSPAYVNPTYLYRPWAELAELLAKITPGKVKDEEKRCRRIHHGAGHLQPWRTDP